MAVDAIRLLQEAEQFAENKNQEAEAEKNNWHKNAKNG